MVPDSPRRPLLGLLVLSLALPAFGQKVRRRLPR